ncbi:unnamed protein product [Paramecium sonneborni]|uniref:Uncharacterized protein n=1 Tax=Paramecium sonneborni TaxID=65129 RepID=A0A8S1P366_9CILI|nr:unnamed protein product [Paramecium sonneborni]
MNYFKSYKQRCKTNQQAEEEPSQLLILCMNCQEYIRLDLTNKHAMVCNQVTENIDHIDKTYSFLDENHFKLQKIRLSLMEKKNNILALRLIRIIELVVQISTIGKVEISCCQTYLAEINQLKYMPKSSLNISLYLERIQVLIEQKIKILKENLDIQNEQDNLIQYTSSPQNKFENQLIQENQSNKYSNKVYCLSADQVDTPIVSKGQLVDQINQKIQECNTLKMEQQYYNNLLNKNLQINQRPKWMNGEEDQVYLPRQLHKKMLTQQVPQKVNAKSEILTNISTNDFGFLEEQSQKCESHSQRLFYSKLLKLKLQNTKKSQVQKLSAVILWDEALKLRLGQEDFDKFLKQAIDNPNKYINNQF